MDKNDFFSYFIIFVLVTLLVFGIYGIKSYTAQKFDDKLVACLLEKNTTLYVLAGCTHCADQEKLIGDKLKYLKVIDCAYNSDLCAKLEINIVPTWIINNSRYEGLQTADKLSEYTNCKN